MRKADLVPGTIVQYLTYEDGRLYCLLTKATGDYHWILCRTPCKFEGDYAPFPYNFARVMREWRVVRRP